jgi:membrane-associated phospholipid phosphatase
VPAAVAALLLALARVYVGVHYPVDTVVGLALGALIGLGVVVGLRSPAARLVERLHDTRYAVLVSAAPAAGDGGDRR